jgi:threonine dehydrogenase-like Zn-dependent dehydrogenase
MQNDGNPAVWFAGVGRAEIRSGAIPSPGRGEALIRSLRTLISGGTELALLAGPPRAGGAWADFVRFPRTVGYSNVGEVVDVGAEVDRSWVGRRVASRGNHAAWIVRELADLRPVPHDVTADDATFTTLACVVMNGLRRARLTWGESVAVFGLGVVGQLCVRIADVAGASIIFGLDPSSLRLDRLPNRSHMRALSGDLDQTLRTVQELTEGKGADLVIEASGVGELIPAEIGYIRDQGRLLLLSSPRSPTTFDFHDLCNRRSLTIVGAHGFSQPLVGTPDDPWTRQRHGDLFLALLADGRVSVRELITHHFPYDRAKEAYDLLASSGSEALAVILDWQQR